MNGLFLMSRAKMSMLKCVRRIERPWLKLSRTTKTELRRRRRRRCLTEGVNIKHFVNNSTSIPFLVAVVALLRLLMMILML